MQTWKPLALIKTTAEFFEKKGIGSARLDAEVLLCSVLGCSNRLELYTGFDRALAEQELDAYRELVRRRSAREPVSHILGVREFMGISFKVTSAVLAPRPETEIMVEDVVRSIGPRKKKRSAALIEKLEEREREAEDAAARQPDGINALAGLMSASALLTQKQVPDELPIEEAPKSGPQRILDLGTGSGCIAISIAALCPDATVVAIDISAEALTVAKENAVTVGVDSRIEFRRGDWFAACMTGETFDWILTNPPYVANDDDELWPEVKNYEPAVALYGGADGMDFYRRLAGEVEARLKPGGTLIAEVGAGQAEKVIQLLASQTLLENIHTISDHNEHERMVKAHCPDL